MIPALLIFLAALAGKLAFDLHLYFSNKTNKHTTGPAIVVVILLVCSWVAGWITTGVWFFGWWIIFNILYALFIGQDWNYIGNTSKLDKFERKHTWVSVVKIFVFVASITATYLFKTGRI